MAQPPAEEAQRRSEPREMCPSPYLTAKWAPARPARSARPDLAPGTKRPVALLRQHAQRGGKGLHASSLP